MDLDAFVALRTGRWNRLRELGRTRTLTGPQADEFVAHYQATTTDYSQLQTSAPEPTVLSRLSTLLGRSRNRLAGAHESSWSEVGRFFVLALPAAFYRIRWWTVAGMIAFCLIGVVAAWWTYTTPGALDAVMTPSQREQYANEAFSAYYSNHPPQDFAAQVWTNNAWIALQMIATALTGIIPVYILVINAVSVGQIGAVMAEAGMLDVFFGLILPHGLLELTAIFIAFGAALKLFWTMVRPGPRTRARALAEDGRAFITIVIGLVLVLGVSGVIEGFVTPSSLPSGVKITIGALALAGYWIYTLTLGRIAVRDGESGDVRVQHAEDTVAMAD